MRNSLMALGFTLSAALWSWSIVPALAADFYILNVTDENNVSLLDPTTIIPAQAGHKAFHLAQIDEFDLWIDNNVEVDCAGKRSRKLSAISHLASGTTVQGLRHRDLGISWRKERSAYVLMTSFANGRIANQWEARLRRYRF